MTKLERKTKETQIDVELGGPTKAETPDPFLSHMVESLGKHSGVGIRVRAKSLDGVEHHYVEDVAIALGRALRGLTENRPIRRYGERLLPMDDALVAVALDAGGRPYYDGPLPLPMYEHFLRSLAFEAGWTLHVEVRRGRDTHHVVEAAVKALALSLRDALEAAPEVASTKGRVAYRGG
jgi:imidazoleglycerol-phosphate dehydratase